MVDQLTENPTWKINLEIEPETWDTVQVKDANNYRIFRNYYDSTGRFGRIEFINPTYAQPYCYNISGESIIRQFSYGISKIKQHFPEATFNTYSCEEPCFTSSLPQILKGFGFHYVVLRNPNTCWGGYTRGFGKDLVNWIGPDGTSIPAVPRYACEKLASASTWQTDSWTNSNEFIAACFLNGIKYPVGMTFQDAGWKRGPWKNQYQPTVYTTWTEYINMIKTKVEADDWKFSQEDIKPGLVWGAQVLQKLAQQVRNSENRMIMAEKMAAMDYVFFANQWPTAEFAEAWRTLMLAQHHDCWIVPYNGKTGNTWADKVTSWTRATNQIANNRIDKTFTHLTMKTAEEGKKICVFNTLGFSRTEIVAVTLPGEFENDAIMVVNSRGKTIESQISRTENGQNVLYFNAAVPPLGYSSFLLERKNHKERPISVETLANDVLKVETNFYSLIFNPAMGGTITSLIDKKHNNIQLVEMGKGLNNLRGYFYNEGKFEEGVASRADITIIENGELFIRLKIENQLAGNPYAQIVTLYKNSPRIDFELAIDWKGQPGIGAYNQNKSYQAVDYNKAFYNDERKLHIEFPLDKVGEKIIKNAPFDVCRSELKSTVYTSWDSIKHNIILNWVDAENDNATKGVALFTDHTTSYINTNKLPLGLTVLFNGKGLWGFDYKVDGPTHIKYALLPHSGDWEQAAIEAESNMWNEPLIGQLINSTPLVKEQSLLEVTNKSLEITSVTVQGNDLFVRFFNTSRGNDKHEVIWNCSSKDMEAVDFNGNMISTILPEKMKNGQLKTYLVLPQFGLQTIKLTQVKAY